jgi:putative ABC transport system permease protein
VAWGNVVVSAALVRARLRAERTSLLALMALVAVTAFLFAAAPLFFDRAADAGLQGALARASAVDRSIEFRQLTWIEPTADGPMDAVEAAGHELEADLSLLLREAIRDRQQVIDSGDYVVEDAHRPVSRLRIRVQTGIDEQIRLVEGRAATDQRRIIEVSTEGLPEGAPSQMMASEVTISRATADVVALGVGDRLLLTSDPEGFPTLEPIRPAGVVIVGIFEILEPEADYWLNDRTLHAPLVDRVGLDLRIYHARALAAPGALASAGGGERDEGIFAAPLRYSWRYFLDERRLDSDDVDELARDLARLESEHPFQASSVPSDVASVGTGLPQVIQAYRAQRRASEGALAVAATGPAGAAAGALALVAVLQARRRRAGAELVQSRGGSAVELVGAQVLEGLGVATPAALLGLGSALAIFGGAAWPLAVGAAGAVAVSTVFILVATSLRDMRSGRVPTRGDAITHRWRARSFVLDLLVVVLAAAGVASLLQRGLVSADTGASGGSFDVYLAVVPLLVGLAAGLVVRHLYPVPIRVLAWLAAALRSLVPALALRSAARDRGSGQLPLVVLMLATAIGVFASVLLVTVERGQETASWREFGADYRLEARVNDLLPAGLDVTAVPEVDAYAAVYSTTVRLRGGDVRSLAATLEAIDAAAYPDVVAGTAAATVLPASFGDRAWNEETAGTRDDPVPAIVSVDIARRTGLVEGETLALFLPGGEVYFRVAEFRDSFAGLPAGRPFVVAPLAGVAAAISGPSVGRSALYVRAPESVAGALREAAAAYGSTVAVASRHERYAQLRDAPLMDAVDVGIGLAFATALGYAALCLAAALVLALAARQRQVALLRVLGVRRQEFVALLLIEHAPVIAVGLVGGVVLGVVVSWLIVPGLGLETFAASTGRLPVVIDVRYLALLGIAPVAVVAGVVLAGAWLVQRADVAGAVRWSEP